MDFFLQSFLPISLLFFGTFALLPFQPLYLTASLLSQPTPMQLEPWPRLLKLSRHGSHALWPSSLQTRAMGVQSYLLQQGFKWEKRKRMTRTHNWCAERQVQINVLNGIYLTTVLVQAGDLVNQKQKCHFPQNQKMLPMLLLALLGLIRYNRNILRTRIKMLLLVGMIFSPLSCFYRKYVEF